MEYLNLVSAIRQDCYEIPEPVYKESGDPDEEDINNSDDKFMNHEQEDKSYVGKSIPE